VIDGISASNNVQVSRIQNNLSAFQSHIRYTSSVCEDCKNEPIYYDAHNIGRCMFCVEVEDID
jgi:hypothetical protein